MRSLFTKRHLILALIAVLPTVALVSCSTSVPKPPPAHVEMVTDTLNGVAVQDPYRWMENDSADGMAEWKTAQAGYMQRLLDRYPGKERLAQRLDELLQIGFVDVPAVTANTTFFEKREGTQNQPVLYRRVADGEPQVVIDPNTLSADGSIAMDWFYPSNDASLLAYGLSVGGSEVSTLYVRNVETGEVLPDSVPYCRASTVAWLSDNSGFYYVRYPAPGTVPEGEHVYYRRIYYHELGTSPADDPLVFGEGRPKTNWPGCLISENDRWLVVFNFLSWTHTQVYVLDRTTGRWITVNEETEASFDGGIAGNTLYLATDLNAPKKKIVSVDLMARNIEFTEIIPEDSAATITNFSVARNVIAVDRIRDVVSHVTFYNLNGEQLAEAPLSIGSTYGIVSEPDSKDIYIGFSSFFIPPRVYRYDTETNEMTVYESVQSDLDTDAYEVSQVMYPSHDSTLVPMFIAHRKGIALDGSNPAMIYAYGCYGNVTTPSFQRNRFLWLEKGGVYALAGIRGGGEYGEDWHQAGVRENKQNSLNDFIAAAEYLINRGYTSPSKLVIKGGSCGGTLVAAVTMQRPELYRVVLCGAGVTDMIRFPVFHAGQIQIAEYGDPSTPEGFQYLYAYSPYHNITEGTRYPAVLFTASDTDTRVHHAHSMKAVARLQAATTSDYPIALRLETGIGHGWGASRARILEELVDEWTFVFSELGISMN